jgi:YHS domain-containing protein
MIDPVCKMDVDPTKSAGSAQYKDKTYYFCSKRCLEKFQQSPMSFIPETNNFLNPSDQKETTTYYPLILIFIYLLGIITLVAWRTENFSVTTLMNHFMGGFFIVFSFFKILDIKGFAESYQSYDILAKRSITYARIYPFIELGLGAAYIANIFPFITNCLTLLVMGVSSIGVIQSVTRKQKIKCVCLGTMFNLPMSTVTLLEDLLMFFMALAMIV